MKHALITIATAGTLILTTLTSHVAAEMPSELRAGESTLSLNGWGARQKSSVLKLYHGGLYLPKPSSDAAAIIAADEPMAIRIQITSVFVKQAKLDESLRSGFQNSTGGNVKPIGAEVSQFRKCFAEKITKGDVFEIVYRPAKGVVVTKNGAQKGAIEGLAFKQALFGIWLGEDPADLALKRGMLQSHKVAERSDGTQAAR